MYWTKEIGLAHLYFIYGDQCLVGGGPHPSFQYENPAHYTAAMGVA